MWCNTRAKERDTKWATTKSEKSVRQDIYLGMKRFPESSHLYNIYNLDYLDQYRYLLTKPWRPINPFSTKFPIIVLIDPSFPLFLQPSPYLTLTLTYLHLSPLFPGSENPLNPKEQKYNLKDSLASYHNCVHFKRTHASSIKLPSWR